MIDWRSVWTNGLWIVGTAVLLATFSYTYWLSRTTPHKWAALYQQRPFDRLFWVGFLLVLLGLVFTSSRWWETAVWLLFTTWAIFNLITALRSSK